MQHLLSVIVPVYNVEKYLPDCLKAIISQSYKNIEIILIDDGSTDTSGTICDQYQKKDSRIRVIHKKNEGCSIARNTGIKNATGDLIAFVDADDIIDCQMYEILINNLDVTNSDVSACTYVKEYETNRTYPVEKQKLIPVPLVFEKNDIFLSITRSEKSLEGYIWNKVWKKSLIDGHFFRKDIVMCEDSIFTWVTLKDAKRACYCDLPMYHYLIQPFSATRNSSIEKYMGALTSYELMLKDTTILSEDIVNNLTKEYLGWNLLIFKQLIKQDKPDMKIYDKIKNNCYNKKDYIFLLQPASRICIENLVRGGYRRARFISIIIGNLLEFRDEMRKNRNGEKTGS